MVSRLAVLLTCTVVAPVLAQEQPAPTDSLRFRRGQWAAHFALGSFGGVGVSRFRSPSRAMLFLVNVSIFHRELSQDDPAGGQIDGVTSSAVVIARLGWRRYRVGHGKVTPYGTVGPFVSFGHAYSSISSGGSTQTDSWSLGVFGDIGALYQVTESLALGAAGSGSVSYGRNVSRASAGPDGSSWEIQLSGVTIGAGLTLLF